MCGIFGFIDVNITPSDTLELMKAFIEIQPRGPDRSKIVYSSKYFLGFHRLALNGLTIDGDQPFTHIDKNTGKTYYLLVNGEIYNYKELASEYSIDIKSSDCSILLELYQKLEYDFTKLNQCLNGEYAMAIICVDKNESISVKLSSDPLSVRPLFWAKSGNKFGFGSTLKSLSDFPFFEGKIKRFNQGSIIEYNVTNDFIGESIYKTWTNNWFEPSLNLEDNLNRGYAEYQDESMKIFTECVRKRIHTERKLGCLLSGGLDSSMVAALTSKLLFEHDPSAKLYTFSIGLKGGTDTEFATMVADHLNAKFHNIIHTNVYITKDDALDAIDKVLDITETWDITTVRASTWQYLLGKYIKENTDVKVILNGDGADEAQMGYLYFYNYPFLKDAQKEHYRLLDNIHYFDGLRVDRCLSMNGLEARVPFLDEEFVGFFRSLPSALKVPTKYCMEKNFIRSAFAGAYPDLLPLQVLWRKKEAFSDGVSSTEDSWFTMVQTYMNKKVPNDVFDDYLREYSEKLGFIDTKEACYYWMRFIDCHGFNTKIIPYYWLPKWSGLTKEPSARTLKVYKS